MDLSKYIGNVFLKVDDIKASGPIQVAITDVTEGRFGKPDLTFDDGTRFSCNSTNVRVLVRAYGKESNNLIDKQIELSLGEVEFEGKPQEAILVKPVSQAINAPPKAEFDDGVPF
jgi:hypothetical protein